MQSSSQITYTAHATARAKQRAIGKATVELVFEYGELKNAPGGADMYLMTKKAVAQLSLDHGPNPELERLRGKSIIVKDNRVITVQHQTKKLTSKPHIKHRATLRALICGQLI